MPKYSIIIPAHNDEARISKALESVRMQTCHDYELIVVCDACTDGTEDVAKRYGAKTICVNYHRDGLSRNAGLDAATGEWVLFMDSDDWWLHEYVIETLDNITAQRDFDILCFGFVWRGVGITEQTNRIWPNVWSKLWMRSAIGSTRFNGKWSVSDMDFTNAMLRKPGIRVMSLGETLYYYNYMRPGSITETDRRRK